jgi:hypothetical protein
LCAVAWEDGVLFILKVTVVVEFGRNLLPTVYSVMMKKKQAAERRTDWSHEVQYLLYVSPGLPFTNSTLSPHSLFTCFVWI